jgi:hypothetical protein
MKTGSHIVCWFRALLHPGGHYCILHGSYHQTYAVTESITVSSCSIGWMLLFGSTHLCIFLFPFNQVTDFKSSIFHGHSWLARINHHRALKAGLCFLPRCAFQSLGIGRSYEFPEEVEAETDKNISHSIVTPGFQTPWFWLPSIFPGSWSISTSFIISQLWVLVLVGPPSRWSLLYLLSITVLIQCKHMNKLDLIQPYFLLP